MTDKAERDARAALFGRIEREVLPAAEKRAASVAPFAVEGVEFGSRPAQKAFGADGELRFEVGRWNGSRFEQIAERVLFPIRPPEMGVEYPADVFYVPGISGVFAHYTPVTRRLDYFEVWHYFLLARAKESDEQVRKASSGGEGEYVGAVRPLCGVLRRCDGGPVARPVRGRRGREAGDREVDLGRSLRMCRGKTFCSPGY